MSELQIFNNKEFGQVRVVIKDGEPNFVANDVCKILDHSNPRMATSRLDDDEKGVSLIDTPGGKQQMTVVNEFGLYNLVLGSRKPEAKKFKRWVTHEVLPDIRKHGMYAEDEILDNPELLIKVATKLKEEKERNKQLETKIELDKPKVVFAEALETSQSSILIGELAKLLKQNGVKTGQNRLFKWLRDNGFLGRKGEYYNMPTQKAMGLDLFEVKTRTINNPNGSVRVTKTTKVTGRGQIYFINKLKEYQKVG